MMAAQTHFGGELLKAFTPVAAWLTGDANAICVQKNSPFKSFDDLAAKAKRDDVTIGIGGGVGSLDHLTALAIELAYGGRWTIVPFQGGGEAAAALLGGHIDSLCVNLAGAADPTKFRLLAHTGSKRFSEVPDVPCFVEFGHKSLDMNYNVGALVKRETDPAIVKALENAILMASNDPGFKKWAKDSKTPVGEPFDINAWTGFLKNTDQNVMKILPMMEESLKKLQQGK